MKTIICFFYLLLVLIIGCEKKGSEDITLQVEFPESFLTPCFYGVIGSAYGDQTIIKSQSEYEAFEDAVRIHLFNVNCDTARLPHLDFSEVSLIGKHTSGPCNANYERQVLKDFDDEKIIYRIKADYYGLCEKLEGNFNWAVIPKIPKGYTVRFQVEETHSN